MVLRSQVRLQHPDGRKRHQSVGQEIEDQREAAAEPGRVDAVAGGVLGQVERPPAIREERAVALGTMRIGAQLEHREMRHQLGRRLALRAREGVDASKKVAVRQRRGGSENVLLHERGVTRQWYRVGPVATVSINKVDKRKGPVRPSAAARSPPPRTRPDSPSPPADGSASGRRSAHGAGRGNPRASSSRARHSSPGTCACPGSGT